MAAHAREAAEPISQRRQNVPAALSRIVMKALEKDPADRPQSAAEIAHVLTMPAATTASRSSIVADSDMGALARRRNLDHGGISIGVQVATRANVEPRTNSPCQSRMSPTPPVG